MDAAYVFRISFRLDPDDVRVDPTEFETVLRVPAAPPVQDGWLLFQRQLWRGNANNEAHLRERFSEQLGVPVSAISFSELETDRAYLSELKKAVGNDLGRFNADSVDDVLHNHLGSSIRVRTE